MSRQTFQTSLGTVSLRQLRLSDADVLGRPSEAAEPRLGDWTAEQWRSQVRSFAEGQWAAEVDGRLVAVSSSLIVHLGRDDYRPHTRVGITDGGYFHNHDPQGDTLYWAQLRVTREAKEAGLELVVARELQQRCRELGLHRILTPLRWSVPGDEQDAPENGLHGDLLESLGFAARGQLDHFYSDGGACLLLEWINPEYPRRDVERGTARVAMVQYETRAVDSFEQFAAQVTYFVEAARGYDADFVVFPEFTSLQLLSLPAFAGLRSDEGIRRLADLTPQVFGLFSTLAKQQGLYVIGGTHPAHHVVQGEAQIHNVCPIAAPDGRLFMQPKLHITPWEQKTWAIRGGHHLAVIETPKARVGVLICYDSEFPEAARYLADQGIDILFVPFCTDDRQGYLRVRQCCQARAVENQIYVATAGLVGNLSGVPGLDVHYGRAAVFTPCDFAFARDGIQAQADSNIETLLVADLSLRDLHRARTSGSVRPRLDRRQDLFRMVTTFSAGSLPEYSWDTSSP